MTEVALQPTPEIPDKLYFKIGEVADVIEHYFVEQEVCTEMEFAPYLEET